MQAVGPQKTARGADARLRQVAFFLPNRLGALRHALQRLAENDIRIAGLSMLEAADHAVVRLVVDRPDEASAVLGAAEYGVHVSECLGVALPLGPRFGILHVLSLLLAAEVGVAYAYGLILQAEGHPVLALQVENRETAANVILAQGLALVGQDDLVWPPREAP